MLWIVLTVVVGIILFIALGFKDIDLDDWSINLKQLAALLALLLLIPGFITKVPANSVGIKFSPFHGTSEETLTEGFHSKNILDKVYDISTEVQTLTVENLTTQTQDAQFVNSTLDIKYRVSSENAYLVFKQYRTLDKMSSTLISPTTQKTLELITTQYNVMDILGSSRNEIYTKLETDLTNEFAKYGIEYISVSIVDMDAGEQIEKAITEEAVAKKAVETAEQELLKAQTDAKQKSVTAQAEQDAAKIKAETKIIEAQAEKDANELLNQSLTDEVLRQQWIDKWNGQMPTYYSGENSGVGLILDGTN